MPDPRALFGVALSLMVLALAGCGGDGGEETAGAARSDRLVDLSQKPPYVNALDLDPSTGDFLITTNKGFWRIDPEADRVTRVRGRVTAGRASSTVGTFLELLSTGPGRLLGSGHPDQTQALPPFLGLIASEDGGRSWRVISRLGEADLHKIVARHGKLYAFDAVLGALLISGDQGKTFTERFTPPGLIIDFEVDPRDPDRLIASTESRLLRSDDAGRRWRPVASGDGIRLVWPAPDALYRAEKDGAVERSRDGGATWQPAGKVPGEPYKFKAVGPERLHLALSDGTIVSTEDGAKSWKTTFRP